MRFTELVITFAMMSVETRKYEIGLNEIIKDHYGVLIPYDKSGFEFFPDGLRTPEIGQVTLPSITSPMSLIDSVMNTFQGLDCPWIRIDGVDKHSDSSYEIVEWNKWGGYR